MIQFFEELILEARENLRKMKPSKISYMVGNMFESIMENSEHQT